MQLITENCEANDLLKKYSGARLEIAMYNESLSKIAIRLTLPAQKEVVYIVGLSCQEMNGRFSYPGAELLIMEEVIPDSNVKFIILRDKKTNFELITTGGIILANGELKDFGNSLDNLIKFDNPEN